MQQGTRNESIARDWTRNQEKSCEKLCSKYARKGEKNQGKEWKEVAWKYALKHAEKQ